MSTPDSELAARIDELESRLAFQDDLIEDLNGVVSRQDRDLAVLTLRLQELASKLNDIADAAASPGDSSGYENPPHY
jgi:SlyX protein